ncbi:F-actin capping protein [Limtongia smithiae]|uniref:F-actin capping protein n=1 Tax=Limtongia smithiae TaxID=1125753 RepID=UPI0034CD80C8
MRVALRAARIYVEFAAETRTLAIRQHDSLTTSTHATTTSMADPFDASLDLLRRLNPKDVSANLTSICALVPDLTEDLLASVDQPLLVRKCAVSGKDYLACDYNRDGDSFRSPWSNKYDPPLADGTVPSESIRKLEIVANDAFDIYRDLYYEGGLSSVYLWELDNGLAGVVLLKKSSSGSSSSSGGWDSIHVFEIQQHGRSATYKLTSTIMLNMVTAKSADGAFDLGGSLTRQVEQDAAVEDESSHIANIGKMIEDTESKMRNQLQEVYFGKTKDIVSDLRSLSTLSSAREERKLQSEVVQNLQGQS